jgi:hypothetical protein
MAEISKSALFLNLNKLKKEVINEEDCSFNRLCKLQKLIKRESALKELCKKRIIYFTNFIFSFTNA